MRWTRTLTATGLWLSLVAWGSLRAHEAGDHAHAPGTPPHGPARGPIRITAEDLHRHGGVPPGWRLAVPPGDPKAGREVFAKLECYTCHVVRGEPFSQAPQGPDAVGPELTGMGDQHPADYFLEAILNPNAVIVTGPGYTGPDGLSIMPDYRESLTVAELLDLVAYLTSLRGGHGHAHETPGHPPAAPGHGSGPGPGASVPGPAPASPQAGEPAPGHGSAPTH